MNHSCQLTVSYQFGEDGHVAVTTLTEIAAGAEVSITYVNLLESTNDVCPVTCTYYHVVLYAIIT